MVTGEIYSNDHKVIRHIKKIYKVLDQVQAFPIQKYILKKETFRKIRLLFHVLSSVKSMKKGQLQRENLVVPLTSSVAIANTLYLGVVISGIKH